MLAISSSHMYRSSAFQPTVSSPLSPRSANIYGGGRRIPPNSSCAGDMDKQPQPPFSFSAIESNHTSATNTIAVSQSLQPSTANTCRDPSVSYSKRKIKQAPSPHQDELKERRRNMFLRKVKDGREEKRFEDIQRLDFLQRQRVWEKEQLRSAPSFLEHDLDEEEEDDDDAAAKHHATTPSHDAMLILSQEPAEELDEVLQREDEELAALLEYMPGPATNQRQSHEGLDVMSSWSDDDDDDYDALFSGLMDDGQQQQQQQQGRLCSHFPDTDGDEIMDMS